MGHDTLQRLHVGSCNGYELSGIAAVAVQDGMQGVQAIADFQVATQVCAAICIWRSESLEASWQITG